MILREVLKAKELFRKRQLLNFPSFFFQWIFRLFRPPQERQKRTGKQGFAIWQNRPALIRLQAQPQYPRIPVSFLSLWYVPCITTTKVAGLQNISSRMHCSENNAFSDKSPERDLNLRVFSHYLIKDVSQPRGLYRTRTGVMMCWKRLPARHPECFWHSRKYKTLFWRLNLYYATAARSTVELSEGFIDRRFG